MAIEFHCEHCNHRVRAPDDAGGRTGKCPHCHNATYIPRPPARGEDDLDLAPLDDREEERRKRAEAEDAALRMKLLHERSAPGDRQLPGGAKSRPSTATPAAPATAKHLTSLIVNYVEAMSGGRLEKAEELARQLTAHRAQAFAILDDMGREELSAYGLPNLPKPVLAGFLKQLRSKL